MWPHFKPFETPEQLRPVPVCRARNIVSKPRKFAGGHTTTPGHQHRLVPVVVKNEDCETYKVEFMQCLVYKWTILMRLNNRLWSWGWHPTGIGPLCYGPTTQLWCPPGSSLVTFRVHKYTFGRQLMLLLLKYKTLKYKSCSNGFHGLCFETCFKAKAMAAVLFWGSINVEIEELYWQWPPGSTWLGSISISTRSMKWPDQWPRLSTPNLCQPEGVKEGGGVHCYCVLVWGVGREKGVILLGYGTVFP